ncbi:sensor histidine kinase [Hyalangium versicolor]|uniref:sensor histidine kinase n=1 Tax=Hyalangium versicolor TaxID=2861190 RepID=UPI001CCBE5B9|nr:HAMP domain-containing sensor histidine kinase [Hyalangium versicolor]
MNWRRFRLPSSLLMRVYLVGIAQFVLIVAVVIGTRDLIAEPPQMRRGPDQFFAYFTLEWEPLLNQPEALQAAMERAEKYMGQQVTVHAMDGRVLASNIDPPIDAPLPSPSRPHVRTPRWLPIPSDGEPHRRVVMIPKEGTPVAYAVFLQRPPPGPPTINFAVLIGLVLGCTAVTSVAFARTLAVPLQRLAQVTRSFGQGMLNVRAGLKRRDELGQVAEAFDEMAERITHLLRSQKELIANVSHELRTPLARIRVALDLASEGDADLARESLADITTDLSELEQLIQDVLTAAKLDLATGQSPGAMPPMRREHLEARTLLDKAATRFRTTRPRHVLEVSAPEPLPALDADPVLLRRALDNLLDNAGKYSEPGTTVQLRARVAKEGLTIEIADQGIGVDASDMPHLFTPFFRSDRSRARTTGGVGLGLALARRIVVAHGGTLTLESQPGIGTTARIILPVAPALPLPADEQADSPAAGAGHLS